ncbi:homocysteine-responsive endoplasmic reticulum-resident ubiquitin-like domain member 1 protein [Rhinatrema bivittatum]|uniref:homocysteine-responsive endoplasmic reticulum-resident ubiquitin-like domain member 1 protein n=1 Tax=Rhinatrema bivittatum TaxID=194408 RepID=UPI00112B4D44|nr:homocysteine-responsive endoplasmic reticulum-resident ubiquitin-like domain member 1 protein [Rhinatrema bivittatum]
MEAAAEPLSETVTLVIKSPNQKQDDQLIEAQRAWSVQQLKAHLRQVFPGQPPEHEQKLIYSGKLLLAHLQLKDVLSKETRHVLHLVCNSKNPPDQQQPNISETKQLPTANPGRSQDSVANSPRDEVRQRALPQNLQESNTRLTATQQQQQGTGPGFPTYSTYSPQQLFWFQQMYARQYYMQYLAAATAATLATSSSQGAQEIPITPAAAPAPQPLPNPFPDANQPVNPNAPPPVNPGANQNLRMNAQGGLVDEEDEINRDWLDWVYTAARFSIFLSILYFYSSLSRFMMVMGAMILMYLHHAGWFLFQQRRVQPIANNPPAAAVANQDQNNNLQNENAEENHETEAANERPATSEIGLQSPAYIKIVWVFFKTFFASLIPEGGPGIAN